MYARLILITVNLLRLIDETGAISVLINQLTGIFKVRVFHYDERARLQDIDEKHAERKR